MNKGQCITTRNLLIFIPKEFFKETNGYLYGKVVYSSHNDVKKFYIIGMRESCYFESNKSSIELVGYYSSSDSFPAYLDRKYANWINICKHTNDSTKHKCSHQKYENYCIKSIIINNKYSLVSSYNTITIVYDKDALQESELFIDKATPGNHFYELCKLLQSEDAKKETKRKSSIAHLKEILLTYYMFIYYYIICFLIKIVNSLSLILKYSSLGIHIIEWLENMKWMTVTIIQSRRITLKTGNYILASLIDMLLGILALKLILYIIGDIPPSQIILNDVEKGVGYLKNLMDWLMGAPAGLKLNYAFNNMLGKFFLYHIHLWRAFLIYTKPVMDFAFKVLFLFGKLGITFQISIAADLLALVSFHTYCIYVYAARLFNIQLHGLVALFRLFLGKKKNPLRERVDSCQYQPNQLFIGTLLFTILLFLMPTTWVYYTVFTTLRLVLIGFGGFLTRLKFYVQVLPVYTFYKWLFHSYSICGDIDITCHMSKEGSTTLIMSMVLLPWKQTFEMCIADTINSHSPIEWSKIVNSIIWGQLLYPL